jgi:autotransporter strand-loop-strand O-heptosyltransferase
MLEYNFYLINGLFFELKKTWDNQEYKVSFLEEINGERIELYSTMLKQGMWMKYDRRYLSNYYVEIRNTAGVLQQRISLLNELKGKKVFITYESSSLGDTIAWIPYCLEFKKKYMCDVVVSSFKNHLFESVYPELEFVGRGVKVDGIIAMLELGWFWDASKEPTNPATIPLQQTACNILHLPYKEIKPRLSYTSNARPAVNEYVCISTKSTSQCKHWDKWTELVDRLKCKGYRVIELSQEADDCGAEKLEDTSLENVMTYLEHCDFYIGLSSGISWLAWAVNTKVVMIANFTEANHEFECIRVENRSVCNGCWNNPMFRFNKGDWNWCPEHEDTPRQFECHRSISVDDVIKKLPI